MIFACAVMMTVCLPYAMGSTAAPMARGEQRTTASLAASFADRSSDGPIETPITMIDAETRLGVSDRADVGLRITGLSGAVLSYKRRLSGSQHGAVLSTQIEGGIVQAGRQAMGGLTVLASSPHARRNAVFGGARYLPLLRLSRSTDRQVPAVGWFVGLQLRRSSFVLLPELAVMHGSDDFIERGTRWLVIPSLSFTRAPRTAPAG